MNPQDVPEKTSSTLQLETRQLLGEYIAFAATVACTGSIRGVTPQAIHARSSASAYVQGGTPHTKIAISGATQVLTCKLRAQRTRAVLFY